MILVAKFWNFHTKKITAGQHKAQRQLSASSCWSSKAEILLSLLLNIQSFVLAENAENMLRKFNLIPEQVAW